MHGRLREREKNTEDLKKHGRLREIKTKLTEDITLHDCLGEREK